jgi:hypothetical protein
MTIPDDWKKTIRRNKLLGMWAAEKLGITDRDADAYSDALAVGTLDPERSDVLSKIRKDFDAAGVVQSDEQILRVMNELTLQAGNQMPVTRGGAPDAVAVMPMAHHAGPSCRCLLRRPRSGCASSQCRIIAGSSESS